MATQNIPIKMLVDERSEPFVPLVSTEGIKDPQGRTLENILNAKLSPSNLLGGDHVRITTSGSNCYINVDLPSSLNLIDNNTTTTANQGALDAHQGYVLKNLIPNVVNDVTSTSTTAALSAYQGYLLNQKFNNYTPTSSLPSVINNLTSTSTTNALSANQGRILNNKFSDLATVATSGSYNDLSNKPTIPSVVNNVTSTSTTSALSAYQGRVLNQKIEDEHTYSTTEKKIGTWIDGKPLYQKVIFTNIALDRSTTYTITHDISNIDLIFIDKAFIQNTDGRCYPLTLYYYNAQDATDIMNVSVDKTKITFWMQTGWGTAWNKCIILNYTKTTD